MLSGKKDAAVLWSSGSGARQSWVRSQPLPLPNCEQNSFPLQFLFGEPFPALQSAQPGGHSPGLSQSGCCTPWPQRLVQGGCMTTLVQVDPPDGRHLASTGTLGVKSPLKAAEQKNGEKLPMISLEPLDPAPSEAPAWAFRSSKSPFCTRGLPTTRGVTDASPVRVSGKIASLTWAAREGRGLVFLRPHLVLCCTLGQAWFPGFGVLMGSKTFCFREFLF